MIVVGGGFRSRDLMLRVLGGVSADYWKSQTLLRVGPAHDAYFCFMAVLTMKVTALNRALVMEAVNLYGL
jgi:hypothetical protein